MSKKEILLIEKKEISLLIEEMTIDNLTESLDNLQKHLNLLKIVEDISFGFNDETEAILKQEETQTKEKVYREEADKNGKWFRGQLHRNLRGGIIGSYEDVYIPESAIRELDLDENDWVQANVLSKRDNKLKCDFLLLEKASKSADKVSDRKQVNLCPVFYYEEVKRFFIVLETESIGENKILLSEADVERYKISDDSVVDYAYFEGKENEGRVIWKHNIFEFHEKIHSSPNKMIKYQKKVISKERKVRPIFVNKVILMVGGSQKKLEPSIRKEIERRKGNFVFLTGDEPTTTIKSQLKKSDCVIVYTQSISHDVMYTTKEICKKNKIPVSYTKNLGSSLFVIRANNLLKANENKGS